MAGLLNRVRASAIRFCGGPQRRSQNDELHESHGTQPG